LSILFFGNCTNDALSTGTSLLNAIRANPQNTTCNDVKDGSGYCVPALYRDGTKLDPFKIHVYYPTDGPRSVVPIPTGFAMVGGDQNAEEAAEQHIYWS
jgi:hypothetical protein